MAWPAYKMFHAAAIAAFRGCKGQVQAGSLPAGISDFCSCHCDLDGIIHDLAGLGMHDQPFLVSTVADGS